MKVTDKANDAQSKGVSVGGGGLKSHLRETFTTCLIVRS